MLTYDLDQRGSTPLYEYLYQCIRQDIITGVLHAGDRLPSKRTLAQHLSIGIITVANAYAQLAVEGYITSKEKLGYFVEDVSNYRQRRRSAAPALPEPREKEFLATWSRLMRETLSLQNDELLKTVPYNGVYELRKAIADYLAHNRAMQVDPAQIIIGAGTEYLYGRLLQMFGPACTFAIEEPGYKKFAAISASYGNPWKYIPIEESGADVVHVSPANHFPTGIVMPVTRRIELFEWVNRIRKRYIIEDDYDSEFRYNGRFILPLYAQDTQNRVIYINTFSKSLVPSLRISYMVLPRRLLARYEETMSFYSCTVSSFEQYTLARFISEGYFERHINKMKLYYREQRRKILAALKASPLAQCSGLIERNAGTHFLLHISTTLSEEEVRRAAAAASLQLSFYSDYSYSKTSSDGITLVINYAGIEESKLSEVIRRLEKIFITK